MDKFTLDDVCNSIVDGTHSTVKDDPEGEYYLLSAKNVKNGQIVLNSNDRRISKDTVQYLRKRSKTEVNDIALTTVGSIGQLALVKNTNYEFQRSVALLKADRSIIYPEYLFYLLSTNKYQSILENSCSGSVQKCLFLDDIRKITIEIPSVETQNDVISTLMPIDDLIVTNQKINDYLASDSNRSFKRQFLI